MASTALASSGHIERALLISMRGGIALVLLTPLIVMASPLPATFFPFIVGKALYMRTLTEIVFGMWVVLALRRPSYRAPRSWLLLIFAAYIVVVLLSSLFGVSPQRSLWSTYERMQGFVDLLHLFALTWVITSVFRSWADWRMLLNINLGISCVMGLLGIAQRFDISVPGYSFLSSVQRLDITLGNATYVGAYMLVNVLVALGFLGHSFVRQEQPKVSRAVERRQRRIRGRESGGRQGISTVDLWRAFWIAAVVLDAWVLYFSGTRGALLVGLPAGLLVFGVGYLMWGRLRRVWLASLVLVVSVVALVFGLALVRNTEWFDGLAQHNVTLRRIANIGSGDDSLQGHVDSALIGLRGFAERPILGWGPENFTIAYDRLVTADVVARTLTSFDQAHNKPIEELSTKGVLGFLGYMALWSYMLWVVARRVKSQSPEAQIFTLFAGAALVAYFVQNLFLFDTPGTVLNFILLMGFMVYVDSSPETAASPAGGVGAAAQGSPPVPGGRLRYLQSGASLVVGLVAAGILVSVAIYVFNVRAYNGARAMLGSMDASLTWEQKIGEFERSIDAFPALANYPRRIMFEQLARNWGNLNEQEVQVALDAAEREGHRAITSEPEEWRLYLSLGGLYQNAASMDPVYLGRAASLVADAAQLAPERIEVNQFLVRQRMVEGDFEGARLVIEDYLRKSPEAAPHFAPLKRQIDNITGQQ